MKNRSLVAAAALLLGSAAMAQHPDDFATGNMHFDAKAMDTNGDNMISKDEFMSYGEKMWNMMAKNAASIPVAEAAKDFASGGLRYSAKAMDADHDGKITKDEFMKYSEQKFDKMKHTDGMISVTDAARTFARGNMPPKSN